MQAPYSTEHLRPIPTLYPITARAVEPNRRLRQLINMSRALLNDASRNLTQDEGKANG